MVSPVDYCDEGYLCFFGASSPFPTDNITGLKCPLGSVCYRGSSSALLCPPGTLASLTTGNYNLSSCYPCPIGFYCSDYGAFFPTDFCSAGYVCSGGSKIPTPNGDGGFECPAGTYCPKGANTTFECSPGTYNPNTGQSACIDAPPGALAIGFSLRNYTYCPPGSYCATKSSFPVGCPPGKFSNQYSLANSSQCASCPIGYYCSSSGLTSPSGLCVAGYYCVSGSLTPAPADMKCPIGFYCEIGSVSPQPCLAGFYNPNNGSTNSSSCIPCPPGRYCDSQGLSSYSGLCSGGFFCPSGSISPTANVCPGGFYCPVGSAAPLGCPEATYAIAQGSSVCIDCSAGYFCTSNATSMTACPVGYYCPAKAASASPCPPGTYGLASLFTSSYECTPCPAGKFCVGDGTISGNCSVGYSCYVGCPVPNPSNSLLNFYGIVQNWSPCYNSSFLNFLANSSAVSTVVCLNSSKVGGLCPAGFYCDESLFPTPCPIGTYMPFQGASRLSQCISCPPGGFCAVGATSATPCPPGYYCYSSIQYACPSGTYNKLSSQYNITSCLTCPGGYLCNTTGLSDFSATVCPPHAYCPAATPYSISCIYL